MDKAEWRSRHVRDVALDNDKCLETKEVKAYL